ncbi:hypothetical protein K2173_008171 [Erythroxylum novogranatense]|uniref:Uncharacterized protein n=1 Tax=Erythroxylum novogranatense TaxID=1862640 RepID=A0AAV8UBZ5_9ROSI|nr:hypothetical protein K2173_008171 [Erythroxylum novogranatense]
MYHPSPSPLIHPSNAGTGELILDMRPFKVNVVTNAASLSVSVSLLKVSSYSLGAFSQEEIFRYFVTSIDS